MSTFKTEWAAYRGEADLATIGIELLVEDAVERAIVGEYLWHTYLHAGMSMTVLDLMFYNSQMGTDSKLMRSTVNSAVAYRPRSGVGFSTTYVMSSIDLTTYTTLETISTATTSAVSHPMVEGFVCLGIGMQLVDQEFGEMPGGVYYTLNRDPKLLFETDYNKHVAKVYADFPVKSLNTVRKRKLSSLREVNWDHRIEHARSEMLKRLEFYEGGQAAVEQVVHHTAANWHRLSGKNAWYLPLLKLRAERLKELS